MKKRFDEICREGSGPRLSSVLPMVKQEAVDLPDIGSMTASISPAIECMVGTN